MSITFSLYTEGADMAVNAEVSYETPAAVTERYERLSEKGRQSLGMYSMPGPFAQLIKACEECSINLRPALAQIFLNAAADGFQTLNTGGYKSIPYLQMKDDQTVKRGGRLIWEILMAAGGEDGPLCEEVTKLTTGAAVLGEVLRKKNEDYAFPGAC